MGADVWVGAITTLSGALVGGVISFVLSRQQINEARKQREEEARRANEQLSRERRFDCYTDFLSQARAYRDSIRSLNYQSLSGADKERIDSLAAGADSASSRVFLVVESAATYDACSSVVRSIGLLQASIHAANPKMSLSNPTDIISEVAGSLRRFQVASREELEVTGVDNARILGPYEAEKGLQ